MTTKRRRAAIPLPMLILLCLYARSAAASEIPLRNGLGFPVKSVFAMAQGHDPWEIAGAIAADASAAISSDALGEASRIVAVLNDDVALQFLRPDRLDSSERLELELRPVRKGSLDMIPRLVATGKDGGDAVPAGYPFAPLFREMEKGLGENRFLEHLDPMGLFATSGIFAVSLAGSSWNIPPGGAKFDEERNVAGLTLQTPFVGDTVAGLIREFNAHAFLPLTLDRFGEKAYAFGEKAASAGAEPVPGLEGAERETVWNSLVAKFTETDFDRIPPGDPVIRMTFANERFEGALALDFAETLATLRLERTASARSL